MPTRHTVKAGECITSIAEMNGFFWDSVWNDPANANLVLLREDPNSLTPGDVVVIPDKRRKEVGCETGKVHRFRKKGIPAQVRLQLYCGDRPRAGEAYSLVVDGVQSNGVTNSQGVLTVSIAAGAKKGTLTIGEGNEVIELQLGQLEPASGIKGAKARLNNLGFDCGNDDNPSIDEKTCEALKTFQGTFDLPETGEIDAATVQRLKGLHDHVSGIL